MENNQTKDENVDFESKIKNAQDILEKLKDDNMNLSDGIKLYEQGKKELEVAKKLLENAKAKFTTLTK